MMTSIARSARWATAVASAMALASCSNLLDVEFPGQIPTTQIGDPTLAPVLVRSAIGDFECAYSNYMSGSSVHSDEYETSNSNVPLANWGERTISPDENDYSIGTCEGNFGMNLTLHTARFQSEDTGKKLSAWTDQQVVGRTSLMAQAKIYGAYAYLLMGEGMCQVAFDGAAVQPPTAALTLAETRPINFVASQVIEDPRCRGPGAPKPTPEDQSLAEEIDAAIAFLDGCYDKKPAEAEFRRALAYNMKVPATVRRAIAGWSTDAAPTSAALAKVRVPVLITHGRRDTVVLPAAADMSLAAMTHARLSWFDDCGHSPFSEDAPRFNSELTGFVQSCRSGSPA